MKEIITVIFKGAVIGVANIIPGVSGGTLAVILGLYDRIIESISGFFTNGEKRVSYLGFLSALFAGAGASIFLLANLMDYLLTNHYAITMFFFIGLIAGGVPAVARSHGDMKVTASRITAFISGALVVILFSLFANEDGAKAAVIAGHAAYGNKEYFTLLAAGFLAGGAMIVPGISGSFILVLMGQYHVIIQSLKNIDILPILVTAIGALSGIVVFSGLINVCLKKAPAVTYYFILGLIAASIFKIFPGITPDTRFILPAAGSVLSGILISFLLAKSA